MSKFDSLLLELREKDWDELQPWDITNNLLANMPANTAKANILETPSAPQDVPIIDLYIDIIPTPTSDWLIWQRAYAWWYMYEYIICLIL